MTSESLDNIDVIKVGGSLLEMTDLGPRLRRISPPRRRPLFIAGGGRFADEVRRLHGLGVVDDAQAHWLAVRSMTLSAHVLAAALPEFPVENEPGRIGSKPGVILDPYTLVSRDAARSLPIGWHITSDSIAAFIAKSLGVGTLTLCKSVGAGEGVTIDQAVRSGWLDPHFPQAASGLDVDWINLRTGWRSPPLLVD